MLSFVECSAIESNMEMFFSDDTKTAMLLVTWNQ